MERDDVVRISEVPYHLEQWSNFELAQFIEYRSDDIDQANTDIAKAQEILDARRQTYEANRGA